MSFSLRRFEIVLVLLIGILLALIWSVYYFAPQALQNGPLFLLPQPTVTNEREAVMNALAKSSSTTAQNDAQRLDTLNALAATSSAKLPSRADRLKLLEQLSTH